MQCLILAGGLGTRLYPATRTIPKCLIEVAGRPFAHWQLEWLAAQEIRSVVFSIGHLGDMVRAEIGDGTAWGVEVTYVDEGEQRSAPGGRCAWRSSGGPSTTPSSSCTETPT